MTHRRERAAALAKYGDKPVGTIVYNQSPEDPSTTFLELIVTREKYRRRKVGTRLLQLVEAETALHGAAQLQASVPQEMTDLQWLLAKNGFAFTEVVKNENVLFLRYRKKVKGTKDIAKK
ncbi:MAG: GNAT family N-acetyltransferase [Candidatus Saccharimonas sp.]|nr:MAG: GNAT family N-acetyltransferase [Candidatus Saccharimonas sp.]